MLHVAKHRGAPHPAHGRAPLSAPQWPRPARPDMRAAAPRAPSASRPMSPYRRAPDLDRSAVVEAEDPPASGGQTWTDSGRTWARSRRRGPLQPSPNRFAAPRRGSGPCCASNSRTEAARARTMTRRSLPPRATPTPRHPSYQLAARFANASPFADTDRRVEGSCVGGCTKFFELLASRAAMAAQPAELDRPADGARSPPPAT